MSSTIKPVGWHSRRHQTRDAQDAAREQYKATRGRAARVRRAQERAYAVEVRAVLVAERTAYLRTLAEAGVREVQP